MLKTRIITAIFLLLGLLAAFYILNPYHLSIFFAAVFSVAAWEWANIAGLTRVSSRFFFVALVALFFWVIGSILGLPLAVNNDVIKPVIFLSFTWWLLAFAMIKTYPKTAFLWRPVLIRLIIGLFILLPAWVSLVSLLYSDGGSSLVLLVLLIVSLADTGAYFFGKSFGKYKLAPQVSPGKTWEGVFGGFLAICGLFFVMVVLFSIAPQQWAWLALLLLLPALVSVVGDLFESMFKRARGIKDSGRILPGHGGVLDRIDGLVAALPVFVMVFLLSGLSF